MKIPLTFFDSQVLRFDVLLLIVLFRLWEEADLEIRPDVYYNLLEDVIIPLESVHVASSYALATALDENTIMASDVKDQLIKLYEEKSKVT